MTHTVHPFAHRLGIIRDWKSRWFAADKKSYRENIKVDEAIRRFLMKKLRGTYTSGIEIERSQSELRVILSTARPGLVIGRSGENATKLRTELTNEVRRVSGHAPGSKEFYKYVAIAEDYLQDKVKTAFEQLVAVQQED